MFEPWVAAGHREQQVLRFWPFLEPDVELNDVYVQNEGLLLVACKVIGNQDGTWQYEYAVQNYNSDRNISSFELPLSPDATVWDIGFHDVDYHSGSPVDGTDWVASVEAGMITWKCTETYEQNEWANAIRWGTTYNFHFTCDRGPRVDTATLGVFKPPVADSVSMTTSTELRTPTGTTAPTGYCCLAGEECIMSTEVECGDQDGIFGGDWSFCESTSAAFDAFTPACSRDTTSKDLADEAAEPSSWNEPPMSRRAASTNSLDNPMVALSSNNLSYLDPNRSRSNLQSASNPLMRAPSIFRWVETASE